MRYYKRALISVSDKNGITKFVKGLSNLGIDVLSTGGTADFLRNAGIEVNKISDVTKFPEILDGRVKTLHPFIHAGILAKRNNKNHIKTLKKHKIKKIDIVVCNLYPFEKTIQKPKVNINEVIENIDIGGPTLIRAAAKNYEDVLILTNDKQYDYVLKTLQSKKDISMKKREEFAVEAYSHTAQYDAIISNYLNNKWTHDLFPLNENISMRKIQNMRYGENPHQKGAFYSSIPKIIEPCISNSIQLQGKELSFNNILDADCAIECVKEFTDPTCVIIKHATPCGIASSNDLFQAWKYAYETDIYSPFGGIVSFNREITKNLALELSNFFLEVIIAPSFDNDALSIFGKKKKLRLLKCEKLDEKTVREGKIFKNVIGGFLVQERDTLFFDKKNWKYVSNKKPSQKDIESMEFAVKCVRHVKSNSVVFVKDTRTISIGGGQTSRVDAVWIATHKGKDNIKGSIMASDAFFPFRDAVDVASKAGVRGIIQPGGSIRDDEVINAANEYGISMVFSGQRYFKH